MIGLKKTESFALNEKRGLIKPGDSDFSIERQCELLGLPKSTYYYEPSLDDTFNLAMMREIDQIFMACPFYGKRRISAVLKLKKMIVEEHFPPIYTLIILPLVFLEIFCRHMHPKALSSSN